PGLCVRCRAVGLACPVVGTSGPSLPRGLVARAGRLRGARQRFARGPPSGPPFREAIDDAGNDPLSGSPDWRADGHHEVEGVVVPTGVRVLVTRALAEDPRENRVEGQALASSGVRSGGGPAP